ncbi:hypothetical protein PTKIN_Ptkin11bG0019400 [Pterospermum kingtungense]
MRTPNPTILILILSLFATSQSIIATTLVVTNQAKQGKVAYVTCHVNSTRFAVRIAPGHKRSVVLPRNIDITSWPPVLCEGTYNREYHGEYHERPYVLYDSHKDYQKCKNKCFIRVTDTSFYRWDDEKKEWKQIFPIIWIP